MVTQHLFRKQNLNIAAILAIAASASSCVPVTLNNPGAHVPPPVYPSVYTTSPSAAATAGAVFAQQPVITIQDSTGAVVTTDTETITITAYSDPACTSPLAGTLAGNTASAVAGVATFTSLSFTKAGTVYLMAKGPNTAGVCSSAITISPAAASQIVYQTQPSASATIGQNFAQPPTVYLEDPYGNIDTASSAAVTLSAFTDSACTVAGSGAISAASNPLSATAGVAAFSTVQYSAAETIYVKASSGGLTSACSTAVVVSALSGNHLAFTIQPSASGTAGLALAQQPTVSVQNGSNVTVGTATDTITLALYTDNLCTVPVAGGTFNVTTNPVSATGGNSAFAGVSYSKVGTFYIGASAPGDTSGCSASITISAAAASQLVYTTQPSATGTAATNLAQAPVVTLEDAYGNTDTTAVNAITLAAYTDNLCTVPAAGVFNVGSNPVSAVAGVATFANVNYSKAETIYIGASAGGFPSICSTGVAVSPGAASTLVFTTQPSGTGTAGVDLAQQPVVTIEDASGNTVTGATNAITLTAYTDNICTVPAVGVFNVNTNPLNAVAGVASFANVHYNKAETIYLGASAGGFASICSSSVAVSPNAETTLIFTTEPSAAATAGVDLAQPPVVTVEDSYGNTVTSAVDAITLSVFTDNLCTVPAAGVFNVNTNPVGATSGVSAFANVNYSKAETVYILASAGGLTSACSTGIVVSPNVATQLVFTTEPPAAGNNGINFTTQPVVTVEDAYGNTVTAGSYSVALASFLDSACAVTPGSGTFTDSPLASASGVAAFSTVSYNAVEVIYVQASAAGLTSACSTSVNVAP